MYKIGKIANKTRLTQYKALNLFDWGEKHMQHHEIVKGIVICPLKYIYILNRGSALTMGLMALLHLLR